MVPPPLLCAVHTHSCSLYAWITSSPGLTIFYGFFGLFSPQDCEIKWYLALCVPVSLCVFKQAGGCWPLTATSTDLKALQNCPGARQPPSSTVPWLPRANFLPYIKYTVLHVLLFATATSPILVIYICAINGILKSELINIGSGLRASFQRCIDIRPSNLLLLFLAAFFFSANWSGDMVISKNSKIDIW